MNKQEIINKINKERRTNKNNWTIFNEYYTSNTGKLIYISMKFYKTWIQILRISETPNIEYSNEMNSSVKKFNEYLQEILPE